MTVRHPMRALALAAAIAAFGCGGGGGGAERGGADLGGTETLAKADAVDVTYYYLPG